MPPPRHFRLTYSGVFGSAASPVEEWSMGVSLIATPGSTYDRTQLGLHVNELYPLWATHFASIVTSQAVLTRARLSLIDANGKTERDAGGAYLHADKAGSTPGTGTGPIPLSVSLAMSLHSDMAGAIGRGRFFLPTPTLALDSNGRFQVAAQTQRANALKAFVDALNTYADGTGEFPAGAGFVGRVCVASGGSAVSATPPALYPVTRVSVGRVPDTQRRRRGDLLEERVEVAVAASA